MAKIKETDYLYSTSRVKSIEKHMLTRERAEKMIDAKTIEDALRVLDDCYYGFENDATETKDYEILLAQEHKKTYDLIKSLAPEPEHFNIFLYPHDYHNLKVMMKNEYLNKNDRDALVDMGTIDLNILQYALKERVFSDLTDNMEKALKEIIEEFPKTKDPQLIDIILDSYSFDEMLKAAKKTKNEFIIDYVRMLIDSINIKTYVRLKRINKSWDFFSKVFIAGGKVDDHIFIRNYDESFEKFGDLLLAYDFKDEFLEGTEALNETGKFTKLEKLLDNKLMEHVKSAKYVPYGIESLVGYLLAKDNEIKTARIILAGKTAGISPELIRERVRETYV